MIPWLRRGDPFPPLETALDEPNGLLAASEDLSWQRLVAAYSRGIFPWYSAGQPVLWWSPDPRMVLFTGEFIDAPTALDWATWSGTIPHEILTGIGGRIVRRYVGGAR